MDRNTISQIEAAKSALDLARFYHGVLSYEYRSARIALDVLLQRNGVTLAY